MRRLALWSGCVATGLSLSAFHAWANAPLGLSVPATIEGEVEAVDVRAGHTRIDVAVARIDEKAARFRARLYPRGPISQLLAGQRILVRTRLKALESNGNPGEFSAFERQVRSALVMSGNFDPAALVVLSEAGPLTQKLARLRGDLERTVDSVAPTPAAGRLYLALAAGARSHLGEEIETDFARSGLSHVLSVSGLHVAALGLCARAAGRWLWVWLPFRRLRRIEARTAALPFALALVWLYTLFTGAEVPAIRSALMTSLLFASAALKRRADGFNSLCLAGLVVVCLSPASVVDLSAQLSLASTAALILLGPALREALPVGQPDRRRLRGWRLQLALARETVLATLCASAAVVLVTAPLLAAAFDRLSLVGVLSNALCLPLCTASAVLAAAGAGVSALLPELAPPLLWFGTRCCQALLWASQTFGRLPLASVGVIGPSVWAGAAWGAGLLVWSLTSGRQRWLGGALVAASVALWATPQLSPRPGLEVTFLAVGHGDAIVLSSGGRHALVDGGGVPGGADTGRRFVLPYLRHRGIDKLDLAVLSHAHPDHALGLVSVLDRIAVDSLWLPAGVGGGPLVDALLARAPHTLEVEAGHRQRLGGTTLDVLGPPSDRILLESQNDRSIVLRARYGEVTFLLTGDLEQAGEEVLEPGPVTVMKAPHHGSKTSSSAALLDRARPRYAVFCVGRHNRFGFPHPEIVERYQAMGSECFRTDLDGAVTFQTDGIDVRVHTFRPDGHAWRASARRSAAAR